MIPTILMEKIVPDTGSSYINKRSVLQIVQSMRHLQSSLRADLKALIWSQIKYDR